MFPCTSEGYYSSDSDSHFVETWHEMEKLVDEGLVRSIGLSNFNMTQVREVVTAAKKHLPAVLQNESHPYLQEKDLRDFCRIHDIVFQVCLGFQKERLLGSLSLTPPPKKLWAIETPKIYQFQCKKTQIKAFFEEKVINYAC